MEGKKTDGGGQPEGAGDLDLWYTEYRRGRNASFALRVERHVHTARGELQRVDVFDTPEFGRVLALDGLVMVTERDEFMYHEMLVHVPMFSHPDPRRVLVIGGGDGGSLREVLRHPMVEEAVLVEIDRSVVEAARRYLPFTSCGMDDARAKVVIAEGGAYIGAHPGGFDVVIIDSTDPTEGAGGLLFTEEFYAGCRRALGPGGVMSAETEDAVYDMPYWKMAVERIAKVFPVTQVYWGMMTAYPSGTWTYTLAGDRIDPLGGFRKGDAEKMAGDLRYYTPDIHRACFTLPAFMERTVRQIKSAL
jgi:spermidine synthase